MCMIIDYFHFPTRDGAINLEKLRLPAKTRAIEKFQSRVSLWTYVGDLEAYLVVIVSLKSLMAWTKFEKKHLPPIQTA